jgi:hypothetical protein
VEFCQAIRKDRPTRRQQLTADEVQRRVQLRERLLSTLDAVAHLSATDGCVVFNRRLQLHSFGSMIDAPEGANQSVPCFLGGSSAPLSLEKLRSFGARRRSAVQLCRACPGALAFVISQDGDLRACVHRNGEVRIYEDLVYW